MIDDQAHLSALYMNKKAQGLLSRCGQITAKLQILLRMQANLASMPDVVRQCSEMVDESELRRQIAMRQQSFVSEAQSKYDPARLRSRVESLAPSNQLPHLEKLMAEASLIYSEHAAIVARRNQKALEAALLQAGWMVNSLGGFDPPAPSSSAEGTHNAGSAAGMAAGLFDNLTRKDSVADDDDGSAVDDLTALRLALKHLESLAPKSWGLDKLDQDDGSAGDARRKRRGEMETRHAQLQDQLTSLEAQYARMADKKRRLMNELGLTDATLEAALAAASAGAKNGEKGLDGLTPSQQIRARLDAITERLNNGDGARFLALSHSVVDDLQREHLEAQGLAQVYRARDADLKRLCMARGIDLDLLLEEHVGHEELEGAEQGFWEDHEWNEQLQRDGAFVIGLRQHRFPVRFAQDGSGRLLAFNRPQSALELLGLRGSGGAPVAPDLQGRLDEPALGNEDATIAWCAQQLKLIRQRMDQRFEALHRKTDGFRAEDEAARVGTDDRRVDHANADAASSPRPHDRRLRFARADPEVLRRLRAFGASLRVNSAQVSAFRGDILARLSQVAHRNAQWEAKHAHYQRTHQEALVLFQRMGERAEQILAE